MKAPWYNDHESFNYVITPDHVVCRYSHLCSRPTCQHSKPHRKEEGFLIKTCTEEMNCNEMRQKEFSDRRCMRISEYLDYTGDTTGEDE